MRVAARAQVLQERAGKRNGCARYDEEGLAAVDIAAQSESAWTKWRRKLTLEERSMLSIWRGGAVKTRTRLHFKEAQGASEKAAAVARGDVSARGTPVRPGVLKLIQCSFGCKAEESARHLWAECPRYEGCRKALEEEYNIPPSWWEEQPRCTACTGWITLGSAPTRPQRSARQVAACRLGIAIVKDNLNG